MLKGLLIKNLEKRDGILIESSILIPKPKEINYFGKKTAYVLTNKCTFHLINSDDKNILLNSLNEFLTQISSVKIEKKDFNDADITNLGFKNESDLLDPNNKESYNLEICNDQILIYGIHEKGLFYGIQTLIQLIKNSFLTIKELVDSPFEDRKELILPEIEIKDFPDLKIRGIAQDISRGQVITVDCAKRFISILSHYKMNAYFVYIEDVFANPIHPLIGKNRGALTVGEIKEIRKFSKEKYVKFCPIFECLGHIDNILQHKEYQNLAEFPGAYCFDISNSEIYTFLTDFISEMSKIFSSKYFHIGCDESFDVGKYRSKEFLEKRGKSEALVEFYEKVYQIAKENKNKHIIMYDDVVRKDEMIFKSLTKDIILMYWDYMPKKSYPEVEKLLKEGYQVIVSPSMLNWQRNFPDNKNSSRNIIALAKTAYDYKTKGYSCLGILTSTWGDMRYYSFRENEIFGAILNGAVAWTTSNFEYMTFINEYASLFYGIEKQYLEKFSIMFTLLSKSASFYYKVSILLPPLFYTYFFKHPFPTRKFEPYFDNYMEFGRLADQCLEIYNEIKPHIRYELKNLEYVEFSAELAKCLVEKMKVSLKVSNVLNEPEIKEKDIESVISDLCYMQNKITLLKDKYEKLWLSAAKRPCIDVILNLFDFLIKKYEEKIVQIKKKIFYEDPYLNSEWICTNETRDSIGPWYFRKIVEINQPIKKAIIQCFACSHSRIFINNEFIGEVSSRFSMSILPIVLRVKAFDVSKNLKKGKNIVAIEAFNYDRFKGAINIFGQIELKNGSIQELNTDSTWICSQEGMIENKDWTRLDYNDMEWIASKSYGRPPNLNGDIFKPDLLNGEISITQDYFGFESYFSNFLPDSPKESIENAIKMLKPYG